MTDDIHGLHHAGILTRNLDGLEHRYTALGFTLSPRSRHLLSAGPGQPPVPGCTANLCALFGDSYIELLGIVDDTAPDPWHTRSMADEYEGFRILNLETIDAAATDHRLTEHGLPTSGVLDLARDIDTELGVRTVRARAVHIDPRSTPEGHLGLAQHLTREYVHQPRYLDHANGALGVAAVLIVAEDREFEGIVDRYSLILGRPPYQKGPLTLLDAGSVQVELVRATAAEEVLPGEPAPAASYLAAMTIRVADAVRARELVEAGGTATRGTSDGFFVSARDAFGAALFFTA
ncbi:VOC family protein [Nocardia sp. NPDC101769]|uniref:VOC family protein n=1 Tax=Nocardia sp. NPDC101769 TaxID=3364333 RepID=UPI003804765B